MQLEALKEVTSKTTNEASLEWKWIGYYGNLKDAFVGAFRKQLFGATDDTLTVEELIQRIDTAEAEIIKAIKSKM